MKFKSIYFLFSVLIQMFVLTSLVTGSPILTMPVIEGGSLPWGNVMTGALFVLFPLNFLIVRKGRRLHPVAERFYNTTILLSLLMGLLWLPVSYFLSGNWHSTFQNADINQQIWESYTYATPVLPFVGYFGMRFLNVFLKNKK